MATGGLTVDPKVIRHLVPSYARLEVASVDSDADTPFAAEERSALLSSGVTRRREFAAGRACAHRALRAIGHDTQAIGIGPGGEPLWSTDVVGSISHAGGVAGAVVGRASDVWGLGIDVELRGPPLAPDVERLVLAGAPASPGPSSSKITFSAKESVFKCLFPRTRWSLEFSDVDIALDLGAGSFTARVGAAFRESAVGRRVPGLALLEGRLAVTATHIFTALSIPCDPVGPQSRPC